MGKRSNSYLLSQAGDHPLLTAEEEQDLTRAYQAGKTAEERSKRARSPKTIAVLQAQITKGKEAGEKLISFNIRLIHSTTFRYLRRFQVVPNNSVELEDAVQDGVLGFIWALGEYDPDLGFRLSTYAVWWIRHFVQRGIDNTGQTIRIPIHMAERRRTVDRTRSRLQREMGREEISNLEVSQAMEVKEKTVSATGYLPWTVSLDEVIATNKKGGVGGDTELIEVIAAETNVEEETLNRISLADLREAMSDVLNAREIEILRLRFEEDFTLQEVGDKFDLTRERVRQIQSSAIRKLKKRLKVSGSG